MIKIILTILALAGLALWGTLRIFKKNSINPGRVIILNGPSGSGKSSIQKEFQYLMMPHLWVKVGIDTLFDNPMPNITPENMDFWQTANPIRWVAISQDAEGHKLVTLFTGEEGERVAYAMNSAIAAYAENGCDVIVDYIAYKPEWLADLQRKLKPYKTCYVAVDIPLEVLEQREAARGTSPVGHARSHYHDVYGNIQYDLRVNSEQFSAKEIAMQLKEMIKN